MARIAPYAELYKDPKGPGDVRPTATKIVEDQGVILITGVSPGNGLGPKTAKALRLTGADVYITNRSLARGREVVRQILSSETQELLLPGKVEAIEINLASLKSVRAGAEDFLKRSGGRLNVLINNAGVMAPPYTKTEDGFELQFGTNHLGHFALFQHLKAALLASGSPSFGSRVVSKREYLPLKAYGQSKLANVYFANELTRRYSTPSLSHIHLFANSLHPGGILTPLARHLPYERAEGLKEIPEVYRWLMTPAQGAATSVWAAVASELEHKGGLYLDQCAEAEAVAPEPYHLPGYGPQAFDPEAERRLWDVSLEMVGLVDE
ncbi:NAD(P)-binding protein [Xylariaceae sp. FL0594]|nr:NAD(P)-binding protein [Xylariaceae sp. FL0594]